MGDRTAVAWCDAKDVLEVRPDLSEDQAERIVAWLESNSSLRDRPEILKALIKEAEETLGPSLSG